jgi:hypothetical protein
MRDLIIGWSIGAVLMLLPIFIAWGFALSSGRDFPKKKTFVITSSALAYGLSMILSMPLAPVGIAGAMFSTKLSAADYKSLAAVLDWLAAYWEVISLVLMLILSIVIPARLRHKWQAIVQATL